MRDPSILVRNRKEMREEMLDEYGYLFCEWCKRSSGFRSLEFHHIVYRSEGVGNEYLHSKDNLIICCDECHRDFHDKKHIREPLLEDRGLKEKFPHIFLLSE